MAQVLEPQALKQSIGMDAESVPVSVGAPLDDAAPISAAARAVPRKTSEASAESAEDNDDEEDVELQRMTSEELKEKALEFKKNHSATGEFKNEGENTPDGKKKNGGLIVDANFTDAKAGGKKKLGAFKGVFVPTCENMWGVLIFLRFYYIVGHAGIFQALCAVFLSFACAFFTVSSMSAVVSSGGMVGEGGPYYMISRAMGPSVGAAVGVMYWLAITFLAVLEVLGAVEGLLMAVPEAEFPGCAQVYGSAFTILLVAIVYMGVGFVSKLGVVALLVVFATMFSYYFGMSTAPETDAALGNWMVSGISMDTAALNWGPHYGKDVSFGTVLSVFFPCFTGILSGANRADVLRDPPKNLKQGTFGAIIFSLFMYSSFMILWGMVAAYPYLQGEHHLPCPAEGDPLWDTFEAWAADHGGVSQACQDYHRRLAGGGGGAYVVEEVAWNPFPKFATIGIIFSSLSQALQCLVVSPRLLQGIAKDNLIPLFNPLAPLGKNGEPQRALFASYLVAGSMVLIGQLDLVAPLLTMCFLVAYAFMNLSCFMLTILRSSQWRPKGIHRKRWRIWYAGAGAMGFVICVTIMFIVAPIYAIAALFMSCCIYFYVNWKMETSEWGSATDGIRYQLALSSLIQLEDSQNQFVNWRPQILILYKMKLAEELKGIKHHEILRFSSCLRKGNGFCVVACVLEADQRDEHALHKAQSEKTVIKSIMDEEGIKGFAEVVVAPSWVEGTNYIIQLTGIGGLVPNTVLLDWPNWKKNTKRARDFVEVLSTALAEDKAVLAVKGLTDMPLDGSDQMHGTIDVWWMIHDGGFMILLSWLLVQHRVWRKCHIRVFTVAEGVDAEKAKTAAKMLSKVLKARRLVDVDVEVILADEDMIDPYMHDYTMRVEERHNFLAKLNSTGGDPKKANKFAPKETIPCEIEDLFAMEESTPTGLEKRTTSDDEHIVITDERHVDDSIKKDSSQQSLHRRDRRSRTNRSSVSNNSDPSQAVVKEADAKDPEVAVDAPKSSPTEATLAAAEEIDVTGCANLNNLILSRSKRAQLVVLNLPTVWGTEPAEVKKFMSYCDTLTTGLDRVLFVHSSGHEIFDIHR